MRNWKKEILSIPNILSLFRLLLIPVYTVLFLRAERPVDYWWAAGILAVSTLTDMVDGKIARRFHMVTNLGKISGPGGGQGDPVHLAGLPGRAPSGFVVCIGPLCGQGGLHAGDGHYQPAKAENAEWRPHEVGRSAPPFCS